MPAWRAGATRDPWPSPSPVASSTQFLGWCMQKKGGLAPPLLLSNVHPHHHLLSATHPVCRGACTKRWMPRSAASSCSASTSSWMCWRSWWQGPLWQVGAVAVAVALCVELVAGPFVAGGGLLSPECTNMDASCRFALAFRCCPPHVAGLWGAMHGQGLQPAQPLPCPLGHPCIDCRRGGDQLWRCCAVPHLCLLHG